MIETHRLILRPFAEQDADDLYEYLSQPMVNCFACMHLTDPAQGAEALSKRSKNPELCFAIVHKDTGKVIGEIEAMAESAAPEECGRPADTFSPCWLLNRDFRGQGFVTEAAHAFFDYLFREKGARRIYAYTEEDNISSQKVCEKLGMRREGRFVEFVTFVNHPDGSPRYETTLQYAILKREWEETP